MEAIWTQVPIDPAISEGSDNGRPVSLDPEKYPGAAIKKSRWIMDNVFTLVDASENIIRIMMSCMKQAHR